MVRFLRKLSGDKGLSLIEVVIAGGLLIVMALGIAGLMTYFGSGLRSAESSSQIADFRKTIGQRFSQQDLCDTTLAGYNFVSHRYPPGDTRGTNIRIPFSLAGDGNVDPGDTVGDMSVTSVRFQDVQREIDNPAGQPDIYSAKLLVGLQKQAASEGGRGVQDFFVNVFFRSTDNQTIDNCLGVTSVEREACLKVGGTWDEFSSRCDLCTRLGGILNHMTWQCDFCTPRGGSWDPDTLTCDLCPMVGMRRNPTTGRCEPSAPPPCEPDGSMQPAGYLCSAASIEDLPWGACCSGNVRIRCPAPNEPAEAFCTTPLGPPRPPPPPTCTADGMRLYNPPCGLNRVAPTLTMEPRCCSGAYLRYGPYGPCGECRAPPRPRPVGPCGFWGFTTARPTIRCSNPSNSTVGMARGGPSCPFGYYRNSSYSGTCNGDVVYWCVRCGAGSDPANGICLLDPTCTP